MFQVAQTRRDKATAAIREMLARGETVCTIPIGKSQGKIWISSDRTQVKAIDVLEIDGEMYFLGFEEKPAP
jgi:hypothetical protein